MHVHQGYSIQCDGYANCYAYNIAADESAKKMTQECEAGNKLQWLAITHMRSIIQGISDGATDAWELENFLTAAAASTSHTWEGNLAHIIDMWRDLRLEKMFLHCNAWFLVPWQKKASVSSCMVPSHHTVSHCLPSSNVSKLAAHSQVSSSAFQITHVCNFISTCGSPSGIMESIAAHQTNVSMLVRSRNFTPKQS